MNELPEPPIPLADVEGSDSSSRSMDLTGAGWNFIASSLPTLVTLFGQMALLAFNVRVLGAAEYGGVVTIASAIAVLSLVSGALRYAVVRTGAQGQISSSDEEQDGLRQRQERQHIMAAHGLFAITAALLLLTGCVFGWIVPLDVGARGAEFVRLYEAAALFSASSAVLFVGTTFNGILTSHERFGLIARITFVGFAIQAGLTVALAPPLRSVGIAIAALAGSLIQSSLLIWRARLYAPWLRLLPTLPRYDTLRPVVRYAASIAVLSATATISSASDAFVIGAMCGGPGVTTFRVGSAVAINLAALIEGTFSVLFPRMSRITQHSVQEEGIAWLGGVVGWFSGAVFGALGLFATEIPLILAGHPSHTATLIFWICAASLCVDIAYHGAVQVIFARGTQGVLAKYSWIELLLNLCATVVGVYFWGPLGSAVALAVTIVVTDIIGFPIIMRGRWSGNITSFCLRHGVLQALVAAATTVVAGIMATAETRGLIAHGVISASAALASLVLGALLLGREGRSRLFLLFKPAAVG